MVRVLVWGDGHYNGSIKTRKTVQSVEVSTEEAALCRSEQLIELYDSLAAGDQQATENQQLTKRRPSVALSPEDLTESEWFYLICVSFSFPPGVGLVGEAYAKQQHLWLTGASDVESTVFTRAILAKTVVCIPLLNGVVELGTTEKVEEPADFVEHVKHFFIVENDKSILPPPRPALSAHSSNTTFSPHQIPPKIKSLVNLYLMDDDDIENEEDDYEDIEADEEDEGEENGSDFEAETDHTSIVQEPHEDKTLMEANEVLQIDMSIGSPIDGSSNLDSPFDHLLATSQDDSCIPESVARWSHDDLELHNPSNIQLQKSEALQPELALEDTHYSRTVSTILHNQLSKWHDSHSASRHSSFYTTQSSFTAWTSNHHHYHTASNSQLLLKYIIFTVPFLHSNNKSIDGDASESVAPRLRKTTSHEELSANHVLAERRRREKLNERFMILRSLVPLVTKMDKASILGDTIEYVKQLRKKIQDLEARDRQETSDKSKVLDKRKIRVVEAGSGGGRKTARAVQVEVSIIESDALVELQCPHREGLLLDVMKKLRELGVEITTVQSCVNGGTCTAEMRAKVKVRGNNGKKVSIMQAKKAINQIISPLLLTP
ncbi:hypothetical protein L2E82_00100 [Cichorium intybus]|uniref:Uncharacterized protein n=1 Tax=Cichorium intybus TaxID=13427 RepID=A0ACB9GXN1_CICIN|nr:hypothetical protein L2E82_00100 [Cichorium intybus]